MSTHPLSYCADQVRRHDPDRFITALFAPPDAREDLLALYAFNLEIAKTREIVSEPLIGRIRLQWWRETIEGIYAGDARHHQVVQPLASAIKRTGLSSTLFERLIDARERDFDDAPPESLTALEAYAEGTSSALLILALEVLGVRDDAAMRAARGVGIGWAFIGLLRAVPFHAARRRIYLPQDVMNESGFEPGALLDRGDRSGLGPVVRNVAEHAQAHLDEARRGRAAVSRKAIPALMLARLADGYLGELRSTGYDPFALTRRQARPMRPLRLMVAAATGRY